MKRTVILFLALVLVLWLAACGETKKGNGDDGREIDTVRSFYHASMLYVLAAETDDTIYYIGRHGDKILYVDKAAGISGPLCGKVECQHNNENCNAYTTSSLGTAGLSVYNDRLYWVCHRSEKGYIVYSAALDGTDHREEAELGEALSPSSAQNMYMELYDGYMFLACELKRIEDGEAVKYNYLCAIPLESEEEPFVILQEKTAYNDWVTIQRYNGGLYIITDDICGSYDDFIELEQSDRRYDFKIRRWDMETHELETVYEEEKSTIHYPTELWVTDDYILFTNLSVEESEEQIYKYDFETGECGYLFSSGFKTTWAQIGIMDGLVSGHMLEDEIGRRKLHTVIKDFDGNVLIDESYDLGPIDEVDSLFCVEEPRGRDEDHVYYSIYTQGRSSWCITIISVALDGSGARVLCTETEDN